MPPPEINALFYEFVSTDSLDDWHAKVEDVLPSYLLESEEHNVKYFDKNVIESAKQYYKAQPTLIVELIEDLFWLGISNLYSAYKSEQTLAELKKILDKMYRMSIPLPPFEKVSKCLASQFHGWGNNDNLANYLDG